jgi:putative flippase GtrA
MAIVDPTAVRYLAVGFLNTFLGLIVIYFAMYSLRFGIVAANVLGYAVGVLVGFVLNRRWTFAYRGPVFAAFVKFLLVLGVAYMANLMTVLFFSAVMRCNGYLAQALGVLPYTVIGYLGSRFFAFGRIRSA